VKRTLCALLLAVCLNTGAQELGDHRGPLVRRLSLAASCATSLWDFQTTAAGAARGMREGNGLLSGANGKPRLGLMFGVKAALCGASFVVEEKNLLGEVNPRVADSVWTAMNTMLATHFARTAVNNIRALHQYQRQQAAGIPAYLKP
jgi:hypothetical protein